MANKFKSGDVVLISGTLTKNVAGKIVSVIETTSKKYPAEYSYIVEFYRYSIGTGWELVEMEFKEEMLYPLDPAMKLLYLE